MLVSYEEDGPYYRFFSDPLGSSALIIIPQSLNLFARDALGKFPDILIMFEGMIWIWKNRCVFQTTKHRNCFSRSNLLIDKNIDKSVLQEVLQLVIVRVNLFLQKFEYTFFLQSDEMAL